ncbi:alpha/beta-hydrolase [Rhizodiscina lignyota]|uniref:Alpha/beta-hydrolase n=1 Tax=Rhizodiscina lignyota TaxID=1504668 RepID=A0A9P4M3G8_9PEZI|nr:alpha/beta-hydrolase [Rhizodiscina lignyota]
MASILTIAILLLLHRRTSASTIDSSKRPHGFCKQLDIPVFATAASAIYDIPRVDNDIEATAWAIYDATRDTPHNVQNIIKNTTTSGIFNIHAQLCVPKSSKKEDVLQIATHGVHYDSRYWDSEYQPEKHSYVDAALKAGYSILTYDRLGVGQSDKPDAYTVTQAPLELEILRQLTLMARNGTLYSFAGKAKPVDAAFNTLAKPKKVVHLGHSFGSFLTSAFIANYGPLSDGAIITGYLLTENLASAGSTSFNVEYAATSCPPFDRPSGYVVCQKNGIQNIFFGGDLKTAFTPELLNYGNDIKQPVPIGELASAFWLLGNYGPSFKAPVQYLLPEFDFYVCRGDCKGLANVTALAQTYPNATDIEVAIQPNTGHALPLHNNATAGFQLSFDFLARHGL